MIFSKDEPYILGELILEELYNWFQEFYIYS